MKTTQQDNSILFLRNLFIASINATHWSPAIYPTQSDFLSSKSCSYLARRMGVAR